VIAISENQGLFAVIMGNPVMINAYKEGVPGNGKPFPDGSKMAKIHWNPKKQETYPGQPTVPGTQHDVDFIRREFITLLGGTAAWPVAAARSRLSGCGASQCFRVAATGTIRVRSPTWRHSCNLQQSGWTDGRNVRIDYRWPAGKSPHLSLLHSLGHKNQKRFSSPFGRFDDHW
jgi:hypothetical protein